MKQDTFANRLRKAMDINNFKQIDLVNKTKIDKTLINKYINSVSEAGSDNLSILSEALGVNEAWLMGYDVPNMQNISNLNQPKPKINEQAVFKRILRKAGFIEKDEDLTKEELKEIIQFLVNNKEILKKNINTKKEKDTK